MNRTKKLICLAVLMVLLLTSVVALAACGGAKDALNGYTPSFSGKSVKDDFELPRTIGDNVKVKWKSSNPEAIEVVNRGAKESYLAKVTLGATVQPVTLTVSASGAGSKDFTVNVQALNATLIASEYVFKYDRAEVYGDFDLPATAEVRGVTATITWSVDEKYSSYLKVDGNKCVVTVPADTTKVEINATFSYNNTTATMPYTFYVAQPKTHREMVNDWYESANVTLSEVKGYVVGIATAYASNYSNASFYIVDEDMCSGYYLFRSKGSAEDGAKLAPGVHVTVTGLTSTAYNNELWETTDSSTFVVDSDLPSKPIEELIYALDNDATSGSPSLKWHTGALTSLTNWEITSLGSEFSSKADTMMKIKKDDVEIAVAYSNYMEGYYTSTESKPAASQFDLSRFKVGDTVSVTGIVSYHSGPQLLPRDANDIKLGTADANPTDGSKLKSVIADVNSKVESVNNKLITATKELDLPVSADGGVTVSYSKTYEGDSVAINGGKITVTPKDSLQNITIEVEYKVGNYTTWTYFHLRSQNLNDQGKADYVASQLGLITLDEVEVAGDVKLPEIETLGATITWAVKGEKPEWLTVGSKITVDSLPIEAAQVTLVATVDVNGKTATAELVLRVAKAQTAIAFTPITAPAAGTYKFAMKRDQWLYATGEMDGYYLGTTTYFDQAADFVIAGNETDGYTITANGKFLEIVPRTDGSKGVNVVFNATQTEGHVWKWNDTIKSFTMVTTYNETEDPTKTDEYFLGTQTSKDFKTISPTYISNASNNVIAVYGTGEEVVATYTLDPITAPAAGTYKFAMERDQWLYATGEMDGYYLGTTTDPQAAADFVIAGNETDGYTITANGKFLEIVPRTDGSKGVNVVFNATQTEGHVWKWNDTIKSFTMVTTYNETEDPTKTDEYFLGTQTSKDFKTISPTYISNASNNVIAVYGNLVVDTEDEPEPEHNFKYEHVADSWTHKKSCSDEGCTFTEVTEDCTIENNICKDCKNEYTAKQIVDRLFALKDKTQSLPGTYKLTGVVSKIVKEAYQYNSQWEIDVNITVEDKEIYCYGIKSDEASIKAIAVGDTITVSGELKLYVNNSNVSTYEFNLPALVSRVAGEGGEDNPQPEVDHGSESAPLTVDQVLGLTDLPAEQNNKMSSYDVWVTGYVVKSVEGPSSGEFNLYISDVKGSETTTLQVYWAASDEMPYIGDKVVVNGYIKYYNHYETTKDSSNKAGTHTLTIAEKCTDEVTAEATVGNDVTVTFDQSKGAQHSTFTFSVSVEETKELVNVTVNGVKVTAGQDGKYTAEFGNMGSGKTVVNVVTDSAAIYRLDSTDPETKGKDNGFATAGADIVYKDVAWSVTGNNTYNPWRIGGKSLDKVDRTIVGKTAIKGTASSVKVTLAKINDGITLNSVTLKVYQADSADATKASQTEYDSVLATGEIKANGELTFSPSEGKTWTDCFYTFVFNVTVSGNKNVNFEVSGLIFYK